MIGMQHLQRGNIMNKILIDDLISIIYAHHKEANHYTVEPNHEAKYMSRLKNKSFDKKSKMG